MKVREAVICLDCDELYSQECESCPKCLSRSSIELRQYFPALDANTKEANLKLGEVKVAPRAVGMEMCFADDILSDFTRANTSQKVNIL